MSAGRRSCGAGLGFALGWGNIGHETPASDKLNERLFLPGDSIIFPLVDTLPVWIPQCSGGFGSAPEMVDYLIVCHDGA